MIAAAAQVFEAALGRAAHRFGLIASHDAQVQTAPLASRYRMAQSCVGEQLRQTDAAIGADPRAQFGQCARRCPLDEVLQRPHGRARVLVVD
ncbi:MAG: hypothetical protein IH986_10375 [Planctomycetes bacterium]|nr:hypothetical protein [Planctomycetota bacterium]